METADDIVKGLRHMTELVYHSPAPDLGTLHIPISAEQWEQIKHLMRKARRYEFRQRRQRNKRRRGY